MSKILQIARREFIATALTKGFIIGAVIVPLIFLAAIPLIIWLTMLAKAPRIEGELAVIDHSGQVVATLQEYVDKEVAASREALSEQVKKSQEIAGKMGGGASAVSGDQALDMVLGENPEIRVADLGADADAETAKEALRPSKEESTGADSRLGLAVIDENAVRQGEGDEGFGAFQLYVRPKLDDRVIDSMREALRDAIREARYKAYDYDPEFMDAITNVNAPRTREITETGEERASTEIFTMMLPFAFMILLMISVMIGGQYLLTTTIEEKSSRVVELLLSAASPMQLMTGKILGQMCVGLLLLLMYSGLGITSLIAFSLSDVLDVVNVVYLFVFFFLAYTMVASLLAAVGSAVNDVREAQSLQTPVMMVMVLPYILWMPITRDPNALWVTILSFIPPVSPFMMMMRMTSSQEVPWWQPPIAIAISAVGAYCCLWFAAKVFRVGLLMYGKPPNFRTLIRWVRMA